MAGVTREIRTSIVMENEKEYRAQVQTINRELRTLESALKLVESEYKGQQNTVAALENKQKALTDVIAKQAEKLNLEKDLLDKMQKAKQAYGDKSAEAKEKLDSLVKTTDSATKETEAYKKQVTEIQGEIDKNNRLEELAARYVEEHGRKVNDAQTKLNDMNWELEKNGKHLDEAKRSTDGCAQSIDGFGKETKKAAEAADDFGKKSKEGIDALAGALAAAGLARGIKAITDSLGEASQASMDFEAKMSMLEAILGASGEEMGLLSAKAREMGRTTVFSASEIADSFKYMAVAGVGPSRMLESLNGIINLAQGSGLQLARTAEIVADSLEGFGLAAKDTDHFANVLAATTNVANVEVNQLGETLKYVAPSAAALGYSVEEVAVALGLMANVGVKSSQAGTTLREAFRRLVDPPKKAREAMEEYQIVVANQDGTMKPFAETLEILKDKLGKLSDQEKNTAISAIFGANALSGMLSVLNATDEQLSDVAEAIYNADDAFRGLGVAAGMAKTATDNVQSKFKILENSTNDLKIAIGDQLNPELAKLADTGTNATKWAGDFVKANPELVKFVAILVAVAGGFMGIVAAIALVKAAWTALNITMSASAWGGVIAAIVGVTAALYGVMTASRDANEDVVALQESAESLKQSFEDVGKALDQSNSQIAGSAAAAAGYISRLHELENQSSLTKAEQREYALLIDRLKTSIPDLNLEIDAQTGLLKDGAGAILSQVEAWKEAQRAQSVMDARRAYVDALTAAERSYYEAAGKHPEVIAVVNEQNRRQAEIYREMLEAIGLNAEAYQNMSHEMKANAHNEAMARADEAQIRRYKELVEAYNGCRQGVKDLDDGQKGYLYTLAELQMAIRDAEDALRMFDDTMDAVSGSNEELIAGNAALEESYGRLTQKADDMISAYNEAYKGALDKIGGAFGLFENMTHKNKQNIDKMLKGLDSQIAYLDTYATNLQKASELDLHPTLLKALSDGSKESADILAAIVKGGGEKVAALNEKFAMVEEGKEAFAGTVAEMETSFSTGAQQILTENERMVQELNKKLTANTAGADTVQGYIDGLRSKNAEIDAWVNGVNDRIARLRFPSVPSSSSSGRSHAAGLSYVPYDDYRARLHEGEMVLTALQARALRGINLHEYHMKRYLEKNVNTTCTNNATYQISIHMAGDCKSGRKTAVDIMGELGRQLRYRGVVPLA